MKEIEQLAAALRQEEAAPPPDDETMTVNPQLFVNRLMAAGETQLAAKALNAMRTGNIRGLTTTPEIEAAAKRVGAERKAAAWRELNQKSATNYPLPGWVQAELGVTY